MKVLWLASNYPSKVHPFDGDFIQRHAMATARYCDIDLVHVVKDSSGLFKSELREIDCGTRCLREKIIYYKPFTTSIKILDRLLSGLRYRRLLKQAVKQYIRDHGMPRFIHLHMAMKAGLTALWIKRKYKVPYILSEHWGGYLPEARPNIKNYHFIYRYYWQKIISNAKVCTFVSAYFQKYMVERYHIKNSLVIPNTVNTDLFQPAEKEQMAATRFIHISTMIYQKNTEAILEACSMLKNEPTVELELFGPMNESIRNLIIDSGLQNRVFIRGEVDHDILSKAIQQSDALILYSRFETFGCVLIEANACGVPVIVSDLSVFHELVTEGINGIFAEGENPAALAEKLKQFIEQKNTFDKTGIANATAEKFSFGKVGKQFLDLYTNLKN
ncbi:MAG: glycosyltransferase [Ferruginibacter sp.]